MVLSVAACGSSDGCRASSQTSSAAQEKVRARSDEVYATFQQMLENLPPRFADVMPCSDSEIRNSEFGKHTVSLLAYQDLRYAVGATPTARSQSVIRFVTDSSLRYPPRSKVGLDDALNLVKLTRTWDLIEYVGVLVPYREEQPFAYSESLGMRGGLEAQLVIYKKGEPAPICHAEFEVEGPGNIDFVRDANDSDAETQRKASRALSHAFCVELRKTLVDVVGSLSEELRPKRIPCSGRRP